MRPPRLRMVPFCLCAVLFLASAAPAPAQTNIWSGGSGLSGNWSDPSNWFFGTPTSGPTNQLLFTGANRLTTTQNIVDPFDLNTLTYDSTAGAYSTFGQGLRYVANGATGPALLSNSPATITFNNSTIFNASGSIGGTGSGSIALGPLTVAAGRLDIPRNGVSATSLTVSTGATIAPASPTSSIGTLTVGATGASITGTYAADIGTGTSSDLLAISGPLTLASGSTLTVTGTPTAGSSYTLANYASLTGTFTNTNLPTGYGLLYGTTSLQLVPVPEPALMLALCAAGAGVIGWRRRQHTRCGVAV